MADAESPPAAYIGNKDEPQPSYGTTGGHHQPASDTEDTVSLDVQPGVQKIEATTSVWPLSHLIIAYVL